MGKQERIFASDEAAEAVVTAQGFGMDEVLPAGTWVKLALTGNMSTGGTSIDRTMEAHPDNVEIAETAARIVGLDVAGIVTVSGTDVVEARVVTDRFGTWMRLLEPPT